LVLQKAKKKLASQFLSLSVCLSPLKTKMSLRANRMARELKILSSEPPHGVAVWPVGDGIGELRAQLRVRRKEKTEGKNEASISRISFFLFSLAFHTPFSHSFYTLSSFTHSPEQGPEGTVYEGGTFDLSVSIPER